MPPRLTRFLAVVAAVCCFLVVPGPTAASARSGQREPVPAASQIEVLRSKQDWNSDLVAAINRVRASRQKCGTKWMPPAKPLKLNKAMGKAEVAWNRYLARTGQFGHRFDGSTPRSRMERQGVRAKQMGEVLAAGFISVESTVEAWLDSPGHCRSLMSKKFKRAGGALVLAEGSGYFAYWGVSFAS